MTSAESDRTPAATDSQSNDKEEPQASGLTVDEKFGQRVRKSFGTRFFWGSIVGCYYVADALFYKISFDDGDVDIFAAVEVQEDVKQAEKHAHEDKSPPSVSAQESVSRGASEPQTYQEAVRRSSNLKRCREEPSVDSESESVDVTLWGQRLFTSVITRKKVTSIADFVKQDDGVSMGELEATGKVKIGDIISHINNRPVSGLDSVAVTSMIRSAARPLRMTFLRKRGRRARQDREAAPASAPSAGDHAVRHESEAVLESAPTPDVREIEARTPVTPTNPAPVEQPEHHRSSPKTEPPVAEPRGYQSEHPTSLVRIQPTPPRDLHAVSNPSDTSLRVNLHFGQHRPMAYSTGPPLASLPPANRHNPSSAPAFTRPQYQAQVNPRHMAINEPPQPVPSLAHGPQPSYFAPNGPVSQRSSTMDNYSRAHAGHAVFRSLVPPTRTTSSHPSRPMSSMHSKYVHPAVQEFTGSQPPPTSSHASTTDREHEHAIEASDRSTESGNIPPQEPVDDVQRTHTAQRAEDDELEHSRPNEQMALPLDDAPFGDEVSVAAETSLMSASDSWVSPANEQTSFLSPNKPSFVSDLPNNGKLEMSFPLSQHPHSGVFDGNDCAVVQIRRNRLYVTLGSLGSRVSITSFVRGANGECGEIEASGKVFLGDLIVAINGTPVPPTASPTAVAQVVISLNRPFAISFQRASWDALDGQRQ